MVVCAEDIGFRVPRASNDSKAIVSIRLDSGSGTGDGNIDRGGEALLWGGKVSVEKLNLIRKLTSPIRAALVSSSPPSKRHKIWRWEGAEYDESDQCIDRVRQLVRSERNFELLLPGVRKLKTKTT